MPEQISNYQCPACTGPLQFDSATGKLKCEYCESLYAVEEIEAMMAEQNRKAEEAAAAAAQTEPDVPPEYVSGGSWGEDAAKMRAYSCPSCSAQLICEETTAATSCPYCGNPTVVPGQFSDTLRPDYVIPFRMDQKQAVQKLKKHYAKKLLLPRAFKSQHHLNEIKGVYVPFWLYDGSGTADVHFSCSRSHSHTEGKYRVTETDHFDVYRNGSAGFCRIPVDASSKMDDSYMDSIEPYDYNELKPFTMSYLPGFLADRYDQDADFCRSRADQRISDSVVDCMRDTVHGYEKTVVTHEHVDIQHSDVKYALMPVWLLNTKWKGKDFLFAVNGQTGKIVGNLPISKVKAAVWFGSVFVATLALLISTILF